MTTKPNISNTTTAFPVDAKAVSPRACLALAALESVQTIATFMMQFVALFWHGRRKERSANFFSNP